MWKLPRELWGRLRSPTPKFWKKIRRFGLFLGTAGGAMVAAPAVLPAWIPVAGGYVVMAGTVIVGLASLTCEDTASAEYPTPNS